MWRLIMSLSSGSTVFANSAFVVFGTLRVNAELLHKQLRSDDRRRRCYFLVGFHPTCEFHSSTLRTGVSYISYNMEYCLQTIPCRFLSNCNVLTSYYFFDHFQGEAWHFLSSTCTWYRICARFGVKSLHPGLVIKKQLIRRHLFP